MEYKTTNLTGKYFRMPGWFFFFKPVKVPYDIIKTRAKELGYTPDESFALLEKGSMFGKGWIAIKVEDKAEGKDIMSINGDFKYVEIIGPYSQMGQVYMQAMKENPQAKEWHNLYWNSPKVVPEKELKSWVAFR